MRTRLLSTLALASALALPGCAHSVHQYAVGDYYAGADKAKGREIVAEAEQFVILSLAFNTDFADEAYDKLLKSCPRGDIIGVNARHSTSMSFLSYTNKLRISATCVE